MPTNEGFVLSYKGENNYIPLYPNTIQEQIIDWSAGEAYGPYQVTLLASAWENKQQTVALDGITLNDIPTGLNILSGDVNNMRAQKAAYELLDGKIGIESLNNSIKFTCTNEVPTIDLTIQINWFR